MSSVEKRLVTYQCLHGLPDVCFSNAAPGKAADFARRRNIMGFHLSITHTAAEAIAHVIAEG